MNAILIFSIFSIADMISRKFFKSLIGPTRSKQVAKRSDSIGLMLLVQLKNAKSFLFFIDFGSTLNLAKK